MLDQTQDALGAELENSDNPEPMVWCESERGIRGHSYTFQRFGPAPDDTGEALDTVRELWEGWGYPVREVEIGPVKILEARPENDAYMEFGVTENNMDLGGESACIPPGEGE
jgi:hypothetical protein